MMKKPYYDIVETPKPGEGIFLATDVSHYLNLPYRRVRYLMNGFWDTYTFGEKGNKAINFYALIEFYVYYQCRQNGMSAQSIKKFHRQLSKDFKTKYPFAHYDIRSDFKSIWSAHAGNLVKGDGKNQFDFASILNPFLKKLSYGVNKIAEKYYPSEKHSHIVIDPKHQFGQPVIEGTNIKSKTIFNLYKAGEPQKVISNLYNIPIKTVREAISFHKIEQAA